MECTESCFDVGRAVIVTACRCGLCFTGSASPVVGFGARALALFRASGCFLVSTTPASQAQPSNKFVALLGIVQLDQPEGL